MAGTRLFALGHGTQALLAGLSIVGAFVGCDKGASVVHVRGKVLCQDGSVPKGGVRIVRFEPVKDTPAEKRRTAAGNIESDGSYELFTRMPGDGVVPGTYNVTFTIWKGEHDRVSLIPDRYSASSTTPFQNIHVDHDQNDLKFEIEPSPPAGTAAKL